MQKEIGAVKDFESAATKVYRRQQAADHLGISLRALDDLVALKKIPSFKIGKRRLISADALSAFIRKAEAAAAAR
jgi:excisionase family DNA binding protein